MLYATGGAVDVLDPAVSLRRVRVLLDGLPPQYRRGGEQWSTEAELLAHLADHVANLTYVTLKANGAKSVSRPKPVPRPKPRRPVPAARQQPARQLPPGGAAPARSWAGAVAQLAAVPGAVIEDTDG